jgi:uncharacterized RDD family membrane protein YckC
MADDNWYYVGNGEQRGPVSEAALRQMLQGGQVGPDDLVWREGMSQWAAARAQPELLGGQQPAAPQPSAYAPPAYAQQGGYPQQGYASPGGGGGYAPAAAGYPPVQTLGYAPQVTYAGFWLRFVAAIIDGIIVNVIAMVGGFIVGVIVGIAVAGFGGSRGDVQILSQLLGYGVGILVGWLYHASMESSAKQASLGKMALGLRVTDLDGNRISFARATGRHFGKFISAFILLIGYIMAGFTERKQALHDIMANCLVLRVQ